MRPLWDVVAGGSLYEVCQEESSLPRGGVGEKPTSAIMFDFVEGSSTRSFMFPADFLETGTRKEITPDSPFFCNNQKV